MRALFVFFCAAALASCVWLGYIIGQHNTPPHYLTQTVSPNDIPVDFTDALPGIGGTKEHPDTCIAYYNEKYQFVRLEYINQKH